MTTNEHLRCQCRQWPASPCASDMTQEDLKCDTCRESCTLITIGGGFFKPGDELRFHLSSKYVTFNDD